MLERFIPVDTVVLGPTWATESMSFWQRVQFYRDTTLWPGLYNKISTSIHMQTQIESEYSEGKLFCARQKTKRCQEASLGIQGFKVDEEGTFHVSNTDGEIVYLTDY